MLARAHSLVRSAVGPGHSTRSQSPSCRDIDMMSNRAWPWPKIRTRHSGIRWATMPNAEIRWVHCFSVASRPAVRITGSVSGERGRYAGASAFGTTSIWGASGPSSTASQRAIGSVSITTTSARRAWSSSSRRLLGRWLDDRCSWCTIAVVAGASWVA